MKEKTEDEIGEIICQICDCVNYELDKARTKFPSFNSAHEGYAVLLEETDELWQEIKQKNQNIKKMKREAIQVAAMAIRFVLDVIEIKK